ncbi:nitric oxide reductase transcriptional regulator NorR [Microbulbifer hainanensis]|uniref:nitric oxide reductase transcriptional regulator NorR n=1 Tax=Microbulbifer hainanensis TaxID=2735675 RepID=UPI0021F80D03|nr:nitric oxide reductase transcriptional regulator NorR [Microbulbifer hainanensis]
MSVLIELALDLARGLTNEDRFDRLLSTIRKAINCDAVALLSYHDRLLKPLAIQGLAKEALGRRFQIEDHPRLRDICAAQEPVRFTDDADYPDPYDGLLLAEAGDLPVHACMGLPLYADRDLIGIVTLDSLTPGAFDQIPQRTLEIIAAMSAATLKTAMRLEQLEHHALHAREVLQELNLEALTRDGGELIGKSVPMQQLKNDIDLVAGFDYTVLIEGETGVGKELVARTVHQSSTRANNPLVYINCASLPEQLAESELFGHVKGAFTSAERDRAGKFQLADGGTLFLDEIGELPLPVQSKLLRALQSGEIQPLGVDEVHQVDVRVIAATNRDLKHEVEAGQFRADLYHRLSVYPIRVPSLRERQSDILLLTGYFLELTAHRLGVRQLKLAAESEQLLLHYSWPGNVRELEHVVSRAALRARSEQWGRDIIKVEAKHCDLDLRAEIAAAATEVVKPASQFISLREATDDFQRQLISEQLRQYGGNWAAVARSLGLDRANLTRLAKRLGVHVEKRVIAKRE